MADKLDGCAIIAIGNPGAGKSTLLNGMAGEFLFKSGVAIGKGMTYKLDEKQNRKGIYFMDTPGLDDVNLRKQAGEAISKALKKGGKFKLLFVVTTESGRVRSQDISMMRVVLEAAQEIENGYGIIINKVSMPMMNILSDKENMITLLTTMFTNINERNQPAPIHSLPLVETLHDLNDVVPDLGVLPDLEKFIVELPTVNLTPEEAADINVEQYDELREKVETEMKELSEDKQRLQVEKEKLERKIKEDDEEKRKIRNEHQQVLKDKEITLQRLTELSKNEEEERRRLQQENKKLERELIDFKSVNMTRNQYEKRLQQLEQDNEKLKEHLVQAEAGNRSLNRTKYHTL